MFRRFTATALSFLLLLAAAISVNEELLTEVFSTSAPQQAEIAFGGADEPALPNYPDGISQRLLRHRVSPRALMGERTTNVISASAICSIVQSASCYRTTPKDLYQHQTSLRI